MDLKLLLLLAVAFAAVVADVPEDEREDDEDKYMDEKAYRRKPLDIQIKVPFFEMFLKGQKDGPSNLGIHVFPDEKHGLIDIHKKWWGKK